MGMLLSQVRVQQISNRIGVIMTNRLRDDFHPNGVSLAPRYFLSVSLISSQADEALRADGTAARTALSLTAIWSLNAIDSGKKLDGGTASANSGVDVTDSNDYATIVGLQSQTDRLVREISDEIEWRVASALRGDT